MSAHIRIVLDELGRREAAAAAAMPSSVHCFGWTNLGSDSGLTEAQEDFVDYWSPARVIEECRATRRAMSLIQQWVDASEREVDELFLDQVLQAWPSTCHSDGLGADPSANVEPTPH